VYATTPPDRQ